MTRALVIGDSHTQCMWAATQEWPDRCEGIDVYRFGSALDAQRGPPFITWAATREMVRSLDPAVPLFFSIGGTLHNRVSLLQVPPEFDFALEAEDRPSRERALLPHRALAAWFEGEIEGIEQIKKLRLLARSKIHLLAPPPPKQCNDFLADMASRRHDVDGLTVKRATVSPPDVRLKFYWLEQRLFNAWAQRNGMNFVPPPNQAMNEDGFLARRLYGPDMTHANREYGLLRLQEISQIAGREVEIGG